MSNPTGVPTKVSVRASTTEWGVGVYRQNVAKRVVIKRVKSADYKRSMLLALRKGLALAYLDGSTQGRLRNCIPRTSTLW